MNRVISLVAVTLSALLTANSHASSSASVTFSDIKLTLVDLNPGDGIAPSVTFGGFSTALSQTFYPATPDGGYTENFGASFFGAVAADAPPTPTSSASSSLSGDPQGAGAIAHAEAVDGEASPAQTFSAGTIRLFGFGSLAVPNADFVLSPYTSLTISGTVDSTVSSTDRLNDATTLVWLQFYDLISPDPRSSVYASAETALKPRGTYTSESVLTATFTNPGASAVFGYFQGDIDASAVSGIPEPSALSMAGAGVILALAAALRRRLRGGR
jgi:hypothetical protein